MKIETLTLGNFETNCYIMWNNEKEALVIDPGFDGQKVAELIDSHQLKVCAYLLTHGHADHVSGLAEVYEKHPAPVYMHISDAKWAFSENNHILPDYPPPPDPQADIIKLVDQGPLEIGPFLLEVLLTPGHSPGGICFYFGGESVLFAGDTIFKGSAGRTDLPGGDSWQLAQSLKMISDLPDHTAIYSGHGSPTTLRLEKRSNYFLRQFIANDGAP